MWAAVVSNVLDHENLSLWVFVYRSQRTNPRFAYILIAAISVGWSCPIFERPLWWGSDRRDA
jgi:hypothetical protein